MIHYTVAYLWLIGTREVRNSRTQSVRFFAVNLVSCQEVEVVLLVQFHLIGQDVPPRHVCNVIVVFAETSVVIVTVACTGVFPCTRLVHNEVVAVGRCKLQVFPQIECGIDGVERSGCVFFLEVVGV